MRLAAGTVVLIAVFACYAQTSAAQTSTPPAQYPHQLTAAELRATIPNSTAYLPGNWGPKSYVNYRSADGHIHVKGPDIDDLGTFRITDDGLLCTKYNKLRNGQETCQTVWLTGPGAMESRLPNGQVFKATVTVAGNPERL